MEKNQRQVSILFVWSYRIDDETRRGEPEEEQQQDEGEEEVEIEKEEKSRRRK